MKQYRSNLIAGNFAYKEGIMKYKNKYITRNTQYNITIAKNRKIMN